MWFARPEPIQRQPHEDPAEWTRKETWKFTVWKCKVYGFWVGLGAAVIVFISAGMPGHFLWHWLGIPVIIAFACGFTAFLFYAGQLAWDLLDRPRNGSFR
jgi:hypothetical protein